VSARGSGQDDRIVAIPANTPTIFNISGRGGDDVLIGGRNDDHITGNAGQDNLIGRAGDDRLIGGDGDDRIRGGSGNDLGVGNAGDDLLIGDTGDDRLVGGAGDDNISGNAGNDSISGGAGDDVISGGRGTDLLSGGSGRDVFRFEFRSTGSRNPERVDQILDFNPRNDTIQLDNRLLPGANIGSGGLAAEDFKQVDSIDEITADDPVKIIYESSTGLVYYNSGQGRDLILLQLDKNLSITAADFEIF
jgi:Ca2+-binding RTX toxin-like protein